MIMNDDTWYVVRNTRGVTGFVGPGSKPVPLTDREMMTLGIKTDKIKIDLQAGDTVAVIGGVWAGTAGVVKRVDDGDMFGSETPVELSFAEVKKM